MRPATSDLTAVRCRLLRSAAALAFDHACVRSGDVEVGLHSSLSSRLLEELAHGQPRCSIDGYSSALADLPAFLTSTGIPDLTIKALDPVAAAKADRVLPRCSTVTHLCCERGTPSRWPPAMKSLMLNQPGCSEGADNDAVAALQHVQLAFTAAGCTADLGVRFLIEDGGPVSADNAVLRVLTSLLTALPTFGSFESQCSADLVDPELLFWLETVRCEKLILSLWFPTGSSITWLPDVPHLTVIHDWCRQNNEEMPVFRWSALASPGLRCLGCQGLPMSDFEVEGCAGAPTHDKPWALIVHLAADFGSVEGLPPECMIEEAPDKHVWRNAAGRDMVV